MAAKDDEKQALWVDWTHDALGTYTAPDNIDDTEELVDDMVDTAAMYADAMLEEYNKRFSGGPARRRSGKRSKSKLDEDPEDDPD